MGANIARGVITTEIFLFLARDSVCVACPLLNLFSIS